MRYLSVIAACDSMNDLVGNTIESVEISDDRTEVYFGINGRIPMRFIADGDCCSASWIEDFDYEGIVGGTVVRVDVKFIEHGDLIETAYPDFQQDEDMSFFYEIITDRGSATLEMRNSSNGYYGGRMILAPCKR